MSTIQSRPLPDGTLLDSYRRNGAYADCYATDIAGEVSHSRFIEAFYTPRVFKLERWILGLAVSRPSTDAQAGQLARRENELLLCDLHGHTRSWLMTESLDGGGTRLYFGSAVVPSRDPRTGVTRMGSGFRALLGFHKLYSGILLGAARARLESGVA